MREKDRRNSIRRDSKSMCEVRIGSEVSRGPVINYAEGDGIGIIIKNNQNVSKGARAHITILDTGIKFSAEVGWTEKLDFDFVRIGLRNITGKPADDRPRDKAGLEETGEDQEKSLTQSLHVQPEKTATVEEASGPKQEYVRDDTFTEEPEPAAVPAAAAGKIFSRKNLTYVLALSLFTLILWASLSLLHDKHKSTARHQSTDTAKKVPHSAKPPITEVPGVKIPSFRDAAIAKAMARGTERTAPLPDFREDALRLFRRD